MSVLSQRLLASICKSLHLPARARPHEAITGSSASRRSYHVASGCFASRRQRRRRRIPLLFHGRRSANDDRGREAKTSLKSRRLATATPAAAAATTTKIAAATTTVVHTSDAAGGGSVNTGHCCTPHSDFIELHFGCRSLVACQQARLFTAPASPDRLAAPFNEPLQGIIPLVDSPKHAAHLHITGAVCLSPAGTATICCPSAVGIVAGQHFSSTHRLLSVFFLSLRTFALPPPLVALHLVISPQIPLPSPATTTTATSTHQCSLNKTDIEFGQNVQLTLLSTLVPQFAFFVRQSRLGLLLFSSHFQALRMMAHEKTTNFLDLSPFSGARGALSY
jgi:hypothetical protein